MKAEKRVMYLLVAGEMAVLILTLLLGVIKQVNGAEKPADYIVSTQNNLLNEIPSETEETEETAASEDTEAAFSEEVETLLAGMTKEEKVAQLFFVTPEALTNNHRVTVAGEATRAALNDYPVGGFLYSGTNYRNETQMLDLIRGAQAISYEQSERYLFAGVLLESETGKTIAAAENGQEEVIVQAAVSNGTVEETAFEGVLLLSLVEDASQFSLERMDEPLTCYQVGEEVPAAVVALQNGADMLCVTDKFTEVYETVLNAVLTQAIPEDVLNQAVGRILTEKM